MITTTISKVWLPVRRLWLDDDEIADPSDVKFIVVIVSIYLFCMASIFGSAITNI